MWDFIKGFLGLPRSSDPESSLGNSIPENRFLRPIWDAQENEEDESLIGDLFPNNRTFSVFTNPLEMHSYFEKQMDEFMKRAFNFSGMEFPSVDWNVGTSTDLTISPNNSPSASLRDEFLKPGLSENKREDNDLDGVIGNNDIQLFMETSKSQAETSQLLQRPQFFSRSVTIRKIRRSDGGVETVRTEKDHTGREETTVTYEGPHSTSTPNLPATPPLADSDIFSQFFRP